MALGGLDHLCGFLSLSVVAASACLMLPLIALQSLQPLPSVRLATLDAGLRGHVHRMWLCARVGALCACSRPTAAFWGTASAPRAVSAPPHHSPAGGGGRRGRAAAGGGGRRGAAGGGGRHAAAARRGDGAAVRRRRGRVGEEGRLRRDGRAAFGAGATERELGGSRSGFFFAFVLRYDAVV